MEKKYKELIMRFLNETIAPMDVERIRTACGIGNWNTALKHCLELLVQGKINGKRTSKGWIFWVHETANLQPWEEVVGKFVRLIENENGATIILTTQKTIGLTISKSIANFPEALQTLKNIPHGAPLAILQTDESVKVRLLRNRSCHKKSLNESTVSLKRTVDIFAWSLFAKLSGVFYPCMFQGE